MGNSFKNTWWIFLLAGAGGIIFFLSFHPNKPQGEGVVLDDIFHEGGFTIQVYSFQDKDRARAALQSLENGGYQAFLTVSDLGEKGVWYRVRVGGITNETAARKMLEEIRKNYNSGFIPKPQK